MNKILSANSSQEKPDGSSTYILELAIVIARKRKIIAVATTTIALTAAVISFILPNVYTSTAKLLPPQQSQSSTSALLSQITGAAGISGMAGIKNPSEMYVAMLRSRTVADRLIKKFDLKTVYDTDSLQKAREKLEDATTIGSGKDGLITIEVDSKRQELVAQIANGYIAELIGLTRILAVTEASQRRLFFERQLESSKNKLADAEVSLKKALDTRGVISVDSESRAIVETVGRLRAQISAKEIQMSSMRAFVTPDNPDFKRTEQELSSLHAELSKLENGRGEIALGDEKSRTQSGLENIKILRDVKYYQMLYELLAKQYEVARLDEAKESSLIQILDPAIEPEKKSKPFRSMIVIVAIILGFFLSLGWVALIDAKRRMLIDPEIAARWTELTASFKRSKV